MSKQITQEESEQLFLFCHRHFVYHYDLQVELVDHLASSIEEQWEKNPEIPFEKALHNTFRKFGITGFSKVKEQKQKELSRKYNVLLWKYLLEFYRWPKMLLTLALTLGLVFIFQIANSITWVIVPYFAILVLGGLIYWYGFGKKTFMVKTIPNKKFMLLEHLNQTQFLAIIICQLPVNAYNISNSFDLELPNNYFILLIIAFFTISLNIILFGFYFYIPNRIKEDFMELYGEFAE